MFDHLGFRVRDLAASRRFYDAIAAALGFSTIDNTSTSFLLGRSARESIPFLWIGSDRPAFWRDDHTTSASPLHLAFKAVGRAEVEEFYEAALANGGTDNGTPGLRGPIEMNYFAAYVLDPDGNNIEAGCRN